MDGNPNFELSENLVKIVDGKCNYCKKRVVVSLDCSECSAKYHPSCAGRVEVANVNGKFSCCESIEKSEVNKQKPRKNSEKS